MVKRKNEKVLRKIHINDEEWKWVIDDRHKYMSGDYESVRIYSPKKKMYRVDIRKVWDGIGHELTGFGGDCVYPHRIKEYIIENLLNDK